MSATTHSAAEYGGTAGGRRRLMPTTWCPSAMRRRSSAVPRFPEAPVTTIRTVSRSDRVGAQRPRLGRAAHRDAAFGDADLERGLRAAGRSGDDRTVG